MAIGWLTVLKSVPWGEVIRNAPKIAEGAKKLWRTASGEPPPAEMAPSLQAELAQLQASVNELHGQVLASSELIKALADQNAELVKRVELHRVRLLWLAWTLAIVAIVAVSALLAVLLR